MGRRNPRAKWVLPEIIDPPERICFKISVPKEKFHIAAFRGALYMLSSAIFWQDDVAHTAKQVALVWREIWESITIEECEPTLSPSVEEIEDGMNTRIVCEGGKSFFEIQVCACPETWLRLANADQLTNGVQPGPGTSEPPPAPGGGTQKTCATLNANSQILLPTLVNTGDTITLSSATGAGWDGGEFDFGPLYRLPNGDQYVGGLDVGFPRTDSGDPVPTANHMSIIAVIGSTPVYLALPVGSAATIPSGVSNAQVSIQVNDSAIDNNQGSYNLCVTVQNNAAATWSHDFNFRLGTYGWLFTTSTASSTPLGTWGVGVGYQSIFEVDSVPNENDLDIYFDCAAIFTKVEFTASVPVAYDWVLRRDGDVHGIGAIGIDSGTFATTDTGKTWMGSVTTTIRLMLGFFISNPSAQTMTLFTIHVEGIGTDPFV